MSDNDSQVYVLAYVSEDNSYVIVSESDVICDMDTVKVGDEVTVISRSRDTGKHMEYSAKVIMINEDCDVLEKECAKLKKKKVEQPPKLGNSSDACMSSDDDDAVLVDLLGRGRRPHKPKQFEGFMQTHKAAGNSKQQEQHKSSHSKRGRTQTAAGAKKKHKRSEDTPNMDLTDMEPLLETPTKDSLNTADTAGSPTKEQLKAMLQKTTRQLAVYQGSNKNTENTGRNPVLNDTQLPGKHGKDVGKSKENCHVEKNPEPTQKKEIDQGGEVKSAKKDSNPKEPHRDKKAMNSNKDRSADNEANLKKHDNIVSGDVRQSDDDDMETRDIDRDREETGDGSNDKDYVSASVEESKKTGEESSDETEEEDEGSAVQIKGHDLLRFSSRIDNSVTEIGADTYCTAATVRDLFESKTESAVARCLMVGVFTNYALTHCSFERNPPKGIGKDRFVPPDGENSQGRPPLPKKQREAILTYAHNFVRRPENSSFKEMSKAEVKRSLGSKLSELRRRYEAKKAAAAAAKKSK